MALSEPPGQADFSALRLAAQQLRRDNAELRAAYEDQALEGGRCLLARVRHPGKAVAHAEQQTEPMSPNTGKSSPALAALARDLREALQRSVECRQRVDDVLAEAQESHQRRCVELTEEADGAALELAATRERRSLQRGVWECAVASRDAVRSDVGQLREELAATEAAAASARSKTERRQLGELRAEVASMNSEVRSLELDDEARCSGGRRSAVDGAKLVERGASLARGSADVAERAAHVARSEGELEERRAEAANAFAVAAAEDAASTVRLEKCHQLDERLMDLHAQEAAMEMRAAPLRQECEALAQHYAQQRRVLFAYGAVVNRPWRRLDPCEARLSWAGGGLRMLVRELAWRCGSPEVAFLRLGGRGAGRIGEQDLDRELFLGIGIDYRAITGLSPQELVLEISRSGTGQVSGADLAACFPEEWCSAGAPALTLTERLSALPWAVLGGPRPAFVSDSTGSPPRLLWHGFQRLCCQRMLAFDYDEAAELFASLSVLAAGGGLGEVGGLSEDVWLQACGAEAEDGHALSRSGGPRSTAPRTLSGGRRHGRIDASARTREL